MTPMLANLGKTLVRLGFPWPTTAITGLIKWASLKETLSRLRVNLVLDVGANEGQFATTLRQTGYQGQIVSFEPVGEAYKLMTGRLATDNRWRGLNVALGANDGLQQLYVPLESSAWSSFLTPTHDYELRVETVPVKRLDDLFDDLVGVVTEPRVFLKMDTQGYDLEVLKGAAGCMQHIVGLESELTVQPAYVDAPRFLEALAQYERWGFDLVGLYEIYRLENRVAEYDCIMERRARR